MMRRGENGRRSGISPSPTFAFLMLAATVTLCAPAAAEVRVGLAVPLSGRMAAVGLAMQRAVTDAVAEVNANGGALGEPITLIVADDGCAAATAEGAAGHLIAERPALVIGHPCSSAATAAATLYGNAEVLLIAAGPRHPDVTRSSASSAVPVLRLAGRDDRQGAAAAEWLLVHASGRRVAIIHDRTRYARGVADATVASLQEAGVAPVAVLAIVASKHDYAETVLRLRESGAEAVLFAGYPEEAAIVVSGLQRIGLAIPVLGSDALATAAFAEVAARAGTRVEVLLPTQPGAGLSSSDGDTADAYGIAARGALEVWLEAARETGSLDARTLSSALRGMRLATPSLGKIQFDLNGDLDARAFVAASARSGRWVFGEK
ncbi:MAG: branched-chain amino acid ABC transporter substrate-binding protein [Hyphomicrobiales bacterium]|nr:branched-chain amino acid ABC transporter substrate-binding protein [Hyphomicrobiales bacterium]